MFRLSDSASPALSGAMGLQNRSTVANVLGPPPVTTAPFAPIGATAASVTMVQAGSVVTLRGPKDVPHAARGKNSGPSLTDNRKKEPPL